jgi:arylsulfatase A-like enzyme
MSRPNILWILTTQWRAQATGYAGDPNARTPHIDTLATESVNYTQAVTPHPMGPHARAALLTGTLSPANGVRDYFDPLPADARTVAHDLRAGGYATAFFGKWHLSRRDPSAPLVGEAHAKTIVPPDARGGFEFWEGFESGFLLNNPWLHGTTLPEPRPFPGYQSEVLVERFAGWQRLQMADRSLFAIVSLEAPHPPYDAPAPGAPPRDPREIALAGNVPRGGEIETKARRELAGYYAHIEATDRAIGRLLGLVGEDWAVVFTSVHGDMHGAHGLFRKGWPYEESLRVPLLVRAPENSPRVDESAISLGDLRALTRGWAEVGKMKMPHPAFAQISMPATVPFPLQCDRAWRGVRNAKQKLILNADGSPWLFFDLARDPSELDNLVGDPRHFPEIARLTPFA